MSAVPIPLPHCSGLTNNLASHGVRSLRMSISFSTSVTEPTGSLTSESATNVVGISYRSIRSAMPCIQELRQPSGSACPHSSQCHLPITSTQLRLSTKGSIIIVIQPGSHSACLSPVLPNKDGVGPQSRCQTACLQIILQPFFVMVG